MNISRNDTNINKSRKDYMQDYESKDRNMSADKEKVKKSKDVASEKLKGLGKTALETGDKALEATEKGIKGIRKSIQKKLKK